MQKEEQTNEKKRNVKKKKVRTRKGWLDRKSEWWKIKTMKAKWSRKIEKKNECSKENLYVIKFKWTIPTLPLLLPQRAKN